MKLESLLKPIRYLDENIILRQYTKLGQKINIDKGKRKYGIGMGLWLGYHALTRFTNRELFGTGVEYADCFLLGLNDGAYNLQGIVEGFGEEETGESKAIDLNKNLYSKYNLYARLPTFLLGAGLIGKFGVDLINSINNQTPLGSDSYCALMDGIGHLSLASSMYLKDTNPKLLERVPLWKRAYNSLKEKISSLAPSPVPVPTFVFQGNQQAQ
jgi:hypothetical protein